MADEERELRIASAGQEDIPVIVELRKILFQEMGVPDSTFIDHVYDVVTEDYSREYESGRIQHFLAYDGKQPVAIAGALIKSDFPYYLFTPGRYGWIVDVYTKPEYRGRQLATKLIEKSHQWLVDQGIQESKLIASGSQARRLYSKIGYRPTWEMSLNLSDQPTYNEYIDQNKDGDGI
jgi:GNAT superfamily N-acetyltransferase